MQTTNSPSGEQGWTIVPLKSEHSREVSRVHLAAFPDFFLSSLGGRFLNIFYREVAVDGLGISFVALEPTKRTILGFVVGTQDPHGFFRRLAFRRSWEFGLFCVPALAKNPRIIPRIVRALRYRGDAPEGRRRALLSSIAVVPELQNSGLGSILLKAWVGEARKRGIAGSYLTTDKEGNDTVNRFYIRNGWHIETEFTTREGRTMLRYILDFK